MKKYILIFTLAILACSSSRVYAQVQFGVGPVENSIKNDGKYALLVQKRPHFMAAVQSGEKYKSKSNKIQFEIVLISEVVEDLATNGFTYLFGLQENGFKTISL